MFARKQRQPSKPVNPINQYTIRSTLYAIRPPKDPWAEPTTFYAKQSQIPKKSNERK